MMSSFRDEVPPAGSCIPSAYSLIAYLRELSISDRGGLFIGPRQPLRKGRSKSATVTLRHADIMHGLHEAIMGSTDDLISTSSVV